MVFALVRQLVKVGNQDSKQDQVDYKLNCVGESQLGESEKQREVALGTEGVNGVTDSIAAGNQLATASGFVGQRSALTTP